MNRWEDAEYVSKVIQDAVNRGKVFKDPLDPTNTKAYKRPGGGGGGGGRCYAGRQARK
jgi:hypothetical protein